MRWQAFMRPAILCALAMAMVLSASAQTGVASVQFDDQTSDGMTVVVQQASLSNGGFIAIHQELNGSVGPVIGHSEYLSIGTHDDVEITIEFNGTITGDITLYAMPHFDSNDNEEYDFDSSGGQEDGPYTDGGAAVTDSASISFEQADTGTTGDDGGTEGAGRDNGDDNDSPGFAAIAVVAALGAAAVLIRRRS